MAFEIKDNSGSMFPNDRKDSANQPDAKGSAMIDGVEYWVSGWNKKTQDGKNWRSLAFTRKDAQAAPQQRQAPQRPAQRQEAPRQEAHRQAPQRGNSGGFEDMDSDIPF